MKLLQTLRDQITQLGGLRRAWLTSFNINIEFIERYILPALVEQDPIKDRMAAEALHHRLFVDQDTQIDVHVFADRRMIRRDDAKWTAVPIHGVSPRLFNGFGEQSLFHPKVIYLEGPRGAILGAGSANLTIEGWSRQQECYVFEKVISQAQFESVRTFFEPLFKQTPLGTLPWSPPPIQHGNPGLTWEFVHSFQESAFLERLFDGVNPSDLVAWSPYFAGDLARFLNVIREISGSPNLRIHLIPDLLNGMSIRTQSSNTLEEQCKKELVTFRNNPVSWQAPADVDRFCHAKVWMTAQKLAIGSWNFTGPGSNAYAKQAEKNARANIEAGLIFPNQQSLDAVLAKARLLANPRFATAEEMAGEALVIPPDVPLDVLVSFDWRDRRYCIVNQTSQISDTYAIRLPDVDRPVALPRFNAPKALSVEVANEISFNHFFHILNAAGSSVYQGVIHELNPEFRRGETYGTIDDILDSLIPEIEAAGGGGQKTPRGKGSDDEQDPEPVISVSRVSYFRLFLAMSLYEEKLRAILSSAKLAQSSKAKELEKLVFVLPGCLEEMVEKLKALPPPEERDSVFRWYLVQEVGMLIRIAQEVAHKLGIPGTEVRWQSLRAPPPPKLSKASRQYLKHIAQANQYGGAR